MASTATPIEAPSEARDATIAGAPTHRLLLFGIGGRVYGCEIDDVREIIPFRRCTRLPGAPPYVCGLINLRGSIVTVLDMGVRLGGASVDRGEGSIMMVEQGNRVAGIGVDEVRDVQGVTRDRIEAAAADDASGGVVRGLAHLDGQVVILLDVKAVVGQVLL